MAAAAVATLDNGFTVFDTFAASVEFPAANKFTYSVMPLLEGERSLSRRDENPCFGLLEVEDDPDAFKVLVFILARNRWLNVLCWSGAFSAVGASSVIREEFK